MVWIHGGAFITGESDDYNPAGLVRHGVIVVTINYRLGALGFLAHPALATSLRVLGPGELSPYQPHPSGPPRSANLGGSAWLA